MRGVILHAGLPFVWLNMVFIFCHNKYAEVENNLKESHQILMDNKYKLEG
jgi:hypothetical protein